MIFNRYGIKRNPLDWIDIGFSVLGTIAFIMIAIYFYQQRPRSGDIENYLQISRDWDNKAAQECSNGIGVIGRIKANNKQHRIYECYVSTDKGTIKTLITVRKPI